MNIAGNAPLAPLDQSITKKGDHREFNIYRHRLGRSKT